MKTVLFHREEGFYLVEFQGLKSEKDEALDHVAINPGTLKVTDLEGNIIWEKEK